MNLWLKIPENEVRKSKLVMIPQFRRRKTGTEKVHLILPDGYNSTSVDALRLAPILRPGRFYLFYKDPRLPKGYGLVPTGQEDLRRIFNELIEESERKAA
ncbi:MAG: hypothetical protein K9M11_02020 [Candidatus Pacebacteria bacterium]|nr:hypothetical protein [Candidatus Paceibacterota bacterium]